MQALYISPLIKKASDPLPVARPKFLNKLLELLVLFIGPPSFLEGRAVLRALLAIDHRYLFPHLGD